MLPGRWRMKLICPKCGLKGTAEESLLAQNVKCPGCEALFLLDGAVLVDRATEEVAVSADQAEDDPSKGAETRKCASCGFVLSEKYLTAIDESLYCQVCIAAMERKKAA